MSISLPFGTVDRIIYTDYTATLLPSVLNSFVCSFLGHIHSFHIDSNKLCIAEIRDCEINAIYVGTLADLFMQLGCIQQSFPNIADLISNNSDVSFTLTKRRDNVASTENDSKKKCLRNYFMSMIYFLQSLIIRNRFYDVKELSKKYPMIPHSYH